MRDRRPARPFSTTLVVVLLLGCLGSCLSTPSPSPWAVARDTDTADAYRAFLTEHPDDPRAPDALDRIEELHWKRAEALGTRASYERFLREHPDTALRKRIETLLEDLDWTAAKEDGSRRRLEEFIEAHPASLHFSEARLRIARLLSEEQAEAERERAEALEAEGASAMARQDDSSSLAEWEEFLARYHATSLRDEAGRRIEELADPAPAEVIRERMRPYLEESEADGRIRTFIVDALVTDELEDGSEGIALLFKEPDYSYTSVSALGARPSVLARQQAILRHMQPGEAHVLLVSRSALCAGPDVLDQYNANAFHALTEHQGVRFSETELITLAPYDELVPELAAPGGRGAGDASSQTYLLSIVYDAEQLVDALPQLPDAARSWALDRLASAGFEPATDRQRLIVAMLSRDWGTAAGQEELAASLAAEMWQVGHADVKSLASLAAHAFDPDGAPERLAWAAASATDTITSYGEYLDAWAEGPHAAEAQARSRAFLEDVSIYEDVLARATVARLHYFLDTHPGHVRADHAHKMLRGESIASLIASERLVARTVGSTIEKVIVSVESRSPEVLAVRVPVGTYFVAGNSSTQNMVATTEQLEFLQPNERKRIGVPVACANRSRGVPDEKDGFTIREHPQQEELREVLAHLLQAGAPYAVKQAATWILTDDASYEHLGVLRRGGNPFSGGTRVIGAAHTARAMRALHEIGVDLKTKRIWRDRERILRSVEDEALRNWLGK